MFRLVAFSVAVLVSAPAVASIFDPPKCKDVPDCVKLAEKTPAAFTPTMKDELEKLSGEVLIKGLKYTHPKPAVNTIVREQVYDALRHADGHSPASAKTLLQHALAIQKEGWRAAWLTLLAQDKAGRPVLVEFIDHSSRNERRLEAMLAYVAHAGERTPSECLKEIKDGPFKMDAPPVVPPDVQPVVGRYVDEIWKLYLEHRNNDQDGIRQTLLAHVRYRREYHERFSSMIRSQIEHGETPSEAEITALGSMASREPRIVRGMLQWANTAGEKLRKLISEHLLLALDSAHFTDDELPLVRKVLIAGARDHRDSGGGSYAYFLLDYLEGLTADEARQIAEVAAATDEETRDDGAKLLIRIAEPYPEYREQLTSRLLGADLEAAEELVRVAEKPLPWMVSVASQWIQERTPDDLRDETVQERFLILGRLVEHATRSHVGLPKTRRSHVEQGPYRCYLGPVMAYQSAVTERKDLAAFGQALPEKTPEQLVPEAGRPGHYEQKKVPAAPPLSPQEATVRWQQFVLARESILRQLTKKSAQ